MLAFSPLSSSSCGRRIAPELHVARNVKFAATVAHGPMKASLWPGGNPALPDRAAGRMAELSWSAPFLFCIV